MRRWPVLLLCACTGEAELPEPIDLTAPLGPTEVRAAVIDQQAARLGGAAAEGQLGDLLIYNDRARFVVQSTREGGGLVGKGGGILDADIVRPAGQPGRDLIIDWVPMADVGHLSSATTVEVREDGSTGTAIIEAAGVDSPLAYLQGAFESPDIVQVYNMDWRTTYTLRPGSPLLEVTSTASPRSVPVEASFGDVLNNVPGLGSIWAPGHGRVDGVPDDLNWVAYVDEENGLTLGMFRSAEELVSPNPGIDVMNFLLSFISLYGDARTVEPGETVQWSTWYGVARSPAELSDAWMAEVGMDYDEVNTTVSTAGQPVAGARVTVFADDAPWTLSITDDSGIARARVPRGASVRFVADGSGSRVVRDLPEGWGRYPAVGGPEQRRQSLASMADGSVPIPQARGLGTTEGTGDLTLPPAGLLTLNVDDGLPFQARLIGESVGGGGWSDRDNILVLASDASIDVPLEAGTYRLIAHRGARFEHEDRTIEVVSGESQTLTLSLPAAYEHAGWWTADTHMHASPSTDGKISMTDRLLVSATTGVQLHLATDHDVLVDYGPLVAPLGLAEVVQTIPAVEVTPLLRGHVNLFPVEPEPEEPGGGAWQWWKNPVQTTAEQFEALREHHPNAVVQINHPFSPGLPQLAGWDPGGFVYRGDLWYDGFEAIEVVTSNRWEEPFPLYLDLVNRGIVAAPMGNTDSHTHRSNDPGLNVTFVALDVPSVSAVTGETFAEAIRQRRTVATNGPFIEMSVMPGSTVTTATEVTVTARTPSWMVVDEIEWWKDGVRTQVVPGTTATFTIDGDTDASFVAVARGETSMDPVAGHRPWAMTSPILLDVDGDGWQHPLPALDVR